MVVPNRPSFASVLVERNKFAQTETSASYAITRDQTQLRPVFQEHIACFLLDLDPDPIVGDDRTRLVLHFELFRCELDDSAERSVLRNTEHAVRKSAMKGRVSGTHRRQDE